jgi:hypothetical protein
MSHDVPAYHNFKGFQEEWETHPQLWIVMKQQMVGLQSLEDATM